MRAKKAPRRWVIAVMGIAAVLSISALGYRVVAGPMGNRVYADAAKDHRREIIDVSPRRWVTDPTQIAAMVEKRGIPRSAIAALSTRGYHLERARLCFVGPRIFVHLVYSDGAHNFSVYLRRRDAGILPGAVQEVDNGKPLRVSQEGRQHVASLETAKLTVLVVDDRSADSPIEFARYASSVL